MAEGTMDQILGWLRGTPPNPQLGMEVAPQLPAYPSHHDAEYARNYGFGDNSINEDYLNNQKARVLGQNMTFELPTKKGGARQAFVPSSGAGIPVSDIVSPDKSAVVDLNKDSDLQSRLTNTMMRAALAANRSPIAGLGFDPSKVVVDSLIKNPNIGGLYRHKDDTIYSALSPDDSILHESTHRGIQKLRELYPDQSAAPLSQLPDEEMVVRWLMKSKGGDPEGFAGKMDAKQRQGAIDLFGEPEKWKSAEKNANNIKALEELAIQAMKDRGKRAGPQ